MIKSIFSIECDRCNVKWDRVISIVGVKEVARMPRRLRDIAKEEGWSLETMTMSSKYHPRCDLCPSCCRAIKDEKEELRKKALQGLT